MLSLTLKGLWKLVNIWQSCEQEYSVLVFLTHSMDTMYTNTHTHLMALCPGLPKWAGTRKVKPIWILLKQETVSGSGIRWAICKSAPLSRQKTTPAPHHSVFTGRMPLLPPNQQRQSTEGTNVNRHWWENLNIQLNIDDSHASFHPVSAHGFRCPAAVNSGLSQELADVASCWDDARIYCSCSLPGIGSERSWNVSFVHETWPPINSACKASVMLDLWLLSQPQSITALDWYQIILLGDRDMHVNNLPNRLRSIITKACYSERPSL